MLYVADLASLASCSSQLPGAASRPTGSSSAFVLKSTGWSITSSFSSSDTAMLSFEKMHQNHNSNARFTWSEAELRRGVITGSACSSAAAWKRGLGTVG